MCMLFYERNYADIADYNAVDAYLFEVFKIFDQPVEILVVRKNIDGDVHLFSD